MKTASLVSIFLLVVYAVIAIAQVWLSILSSENFFKVTLTFAIVIVVTVIVALVRREYVDDKQMRKNGYID
jgi:hypothetical protein